MYIGVLRPMVLNVMWVVGIRYIIDTTTGHTVQRVSAYEHLYYI